MRVLARLAACALLVGASGCSEFPATDVGVVGDQTAPSEVPDAGDDSGGSASGSGDGGGSGSDEDEAECEVEDGECTACTSAATCEDGLECLEGLCRECIEDADCDALETCDRGSCEEAED